ncbi:MAG: hypothetical protein M1825_004690 [Sarcosagium campestre]|nr:MAG: hypothetical protein M1825_004690 [Sarcosagium campestre]
MPRVAHPPRANGRANAKQSAAVNPFQLPVNIPLNDDAREKAVRLQSRQALHDLQLNQLKAAASPMRKLNNYERAASSSPRTPQDTSRGQNREIEPTGLGVLGNASSTPSQRVPILANFEEWMKMATDNKINATNSWNFALIDYFHDMSLLKEGDGVNFQKASCTLDGCVKIYTSRVDSVATETGKLLSGLADSGDKKRGAEGAEGEDGEEGEEVEGEDGVKKRTKKRTQRSSEATLAPSFAPLQLKKFELEFSVDPLFKKASADFDEGGAKGLLLNHLAIDSHGRIVFDSSDDTEDASAEAESRRRRSGAVLENVPEGNEEEEGDEALVQDGSLVFDEEDMDMDDYEEEDEEIDLASLGARFFPDLSLLDGQDVCPSLKTFDLGDPTTSSEIPFLKASEEDRDDGYGQHDGIADKSGVFLDDNAPGFGDDDEALGGFDVPPDTGFGEGGDAWARDAAIEPQLRSGSEGLEGGALDGGNGGGGGYDVDNGDYVVALSQPRGKDGGMHDDILSYFDQALQKNWAGPEHWRIRKIKDIAKSTTAGPKVRKEKEPFKIDFLSPLEPTTAEGIYTAASSNSAISLPRTQWKSKTRNLLPDDKHFNSKELLRLFLKPRARMNARRKTFNSFGKPHEEADGEMDEAFWARKEDPANAAAADRAGMAGNYDANFFQDDGLAFPGGLPDDDDDVEFADARENFSPDLDGGVVGMTGMGGIDTVLAADSQAFGTQLVTQSRRLRPEYVQYARVAKKVDVRRLKEEMWKGMGIGGPEDNTDTTSSAAASKVAPHPPPLPVDMTTDGSLKFTSVMSNLQTVYPKQAMADISTSYCFICLLHLANEKGLEIASEESLTELNIKRDFTAEIVSEG